MFIINIIHLNRQGWGLFLMSIFCIAGCKKLVVVDPPVTSVTQTNVYSSDATAAAVMTGLYTNLTPTDPESASLPVLSIWGALSADELTLWSGVNGSTAYYYYTNSLSINTAGSELWSVNYSNIFTCNSVIEGVNSATTLTPAVKQQLLGEAKFMRAFFYFYLVNLYGDVPLVTSTDYSINAKLARSPKDKIYRQIVTDLHEAQHQLSDKYLDATLLAGTPEKLRPTKWAATALLARTYLHMGNWAGADSAASVLIGNTNYSLGPLSGTSGVFTRNSSEAIWQLQPLNAGWNTEFARLFIIPVTGPSTTYYVYLSDSLLNSFEIGDNRRSNWVDSIVANGTTYYYPYKYQSATFNADVTEYYMVLRLGEQYLIRAEARSQESNLTDATADLNVIRNRASLNNYSGPMDKNSIITAIMHERRIELFTEWGQRWLDLKRTAIVDAVMTQACPAKNTTWNTNQQLYPLPLRDLQTNVNLSQNPGY